MASKRNPARPDALVSDETHEGLDLQGVTLKRSELEGCIFLDCSFARADLTDARLNAPVFRHCDLSGARIAGCNLFAARFERCKMLGLDFTDGVTFTGTSFVSCIIDYSVFRGVSLERIAFERCS